MKKCLPVAAGRQSFKRQMLKITHKQYSIPDAEKQGKVRLKAFFVALSEY